MARMASLWRCKCGTLVKVVAERDSNLSAAQTASCPTCGDSRTVYADRIIAVTQDILKGSPSSVPCAEKDRLLVAQNNAFNVYMHGASELSEAVGRMAHSEFEFLANRVSAAREFWRETRRRLNHHTAQHGC